MTEELSSKLSICGGIAAIFIVFIHAPTLNINFFEVSDENFYANYNIFLQHLISGGLARFALMFFFVSSGYLFFRNFTPDIETYLKKLKTRLRSVALPYLIWSFFGLVFIVLLETLVFKNRIFTHRPITDYTLQEYLHKWIVDPVQHPLWFLRELLKYILISPLLYFLVEKGKWFFFSLLFLFWFINYDLVLFSNKGIFFFSLGAMIAIHQLRLPANFKRWTPVLILLWISASSIRTHMIYFTSNEDLQLYILVATRLAEFSGILALWFGYDLLDKTFKVGLNKKLLEISSFSFFIYVFHDPALSVVRNVLLKITGISNFSTLVIFFASPFVTIVIGILIAISLKSYFNPFYKVITGNR